MLVIKVELWSAITGKKTEIARMHIANTGEDTSGGKRRRYNYTCKTLRGRSAKEFEKRTVQRCGMILDYYRNQHVWNLVYRALNNMGYGGGKK
jgi:hypothetical protein